MTVLHVEIDIWQGNYIVKHKKWYTFYSPKKCKTLAFISQEAVCFTAIYGVSLVTNHQSRLHTKLFYTKLFTLGTEMKEYLVYSLS